MPLIRLAGGAAPELPPAERADIFEGIALITAGLHSEIHAAAFHACEAIREAETQQMTFAVILQGKEPA